MRRRDAMRWLGAAAAMFGVEAKGEVDVPALPDASMRGSNPEAYWQRIREEQFLLPGWRAYLNNGSLGVAPKPVVAAVAGSLARGASLVTDEYPRWGYETLEAERAELASFLGCSKDELAITHNATEAMSTIAAGVDLAAGDEVVITDQEHPSGRSGWLMRQARHGVAVREVKIPLPPRDPGQVADMLISALGQRTKVLSFSGITTTTGLILPVRQICDAARAKGVLTVVDAAHMAGQVPLNITSLGCDYLAGSPHKWLFSAPGSGFLYGRGDALDRLWPSIVTGGWDNKALKAARFMMIGTNNRPIVDGTIAGLRFHRAIGSEAIFGRIHELGRRVRAEAVKRPYLELLTPEDDRMYAALVSFRVPGKDLQPLFAACKERRIWILQGERLRISTHIHTRPEDISRFFEVLDRTFA